jgi:pimeloyl-ACP methyl ester carboxylesterase
MSEVMGRLIPDARVVILAGQKHVPWLEQPHTVAGHICQFLGIG